MTNIQLRTKTWAELAKWHHIGITSHWYQLNAGGGSMNLYHKSHPETWRVDAQTCEERNSEAFALNQQFIAAGVNVKITCNSDGSGWIEVLGK